MKFRFTFLLAITAAILCAGNLHAQACGGCGGGIAGLGSYSTHAVTTSQAADLWGGYCYDGCGSGGSLFGSRCGLGGFGGFGNRCGGGGGGLLGGAGVACGCGTGAFGYPDCGGCGNAGGGVATGFAGAAYADAGCGNANYVDTGCGGGAFGGGRSCGLFKGCRLLRGHGNACGNNSCFGGGADIMYGDNFYTGGCAVYQDSWNAGNCGCGGDGGCGGGHGCGLLSRLFGKFRGQGGCGMQCGLFGGNGCGGHSGGCGLFSGRGLRCRSHRGNGRFFNVFAGSDYGMMDMNSAVAGTITGACGCGDGHANLAAPVSVDSANDPNAAPGAVQYGEVLQGSTYDYGSNNISGEIEGPADAVEGAVEAAGEGN